MSKKKILKMTKQSQNVIENKGKCPENKATKCQNKPKQTQKARILLSIKVVRRPKPGCY
jgi:hypothetical protein